MSVNKQSCYNELALINAAALATSVLSLTARARVGQLISVGAGLLVVPLVGSLDSRRIAGFQQQLFEQVVAQCAHAVVRLLPKVYDFSALRRKNRTQKSASTMLPQAESSATRATA